MALSGSYDFSLDRDGIITEAFELAGATGIGETPTANELTSGGRMLNIMLKGWQTEGLFLWMNRRVTLFPEYQAESYTLGPSGDHFTLTSDAVKTEIATAASETDTTITVDSATSIAASDIIGIELDDGTIQWTTVSGNPVGAVITIADALEDDVSVDSHVYAYTTKAQRPIEILEGRRIDSSENSTPLIIVSRSEYLSLTDKSSSGVTSQIYYDPQLTNGVLYTWPTCGDVKERYEFTAKMPISDFDASTNDGEFPTEWTDAIVSNLASRLCVKLGIPSDIRLEKMAAESKFLAKTHSPSPSSIFLRPESR